MTHTTHACNYVDYKWADQNEARYFFNDIFIEARHIVRQHRSWFLRETKNAHLHPAVYDMMDEYRPDNWQQLLLEWPHKSETDPNRLAYTRDERAGEADKQVITTIGKYLTRHFSHAPDHLVRDLVAKYTYGGNIAILTDTAGIVHAVMNGPNSCMSKDFELRCEDGTTRHPYAVYDPALGWGMAVRREGDAILGRALVFTSPDDPDTKTFVRSYKRERDSSSHSGADEAIEIHLKGLGYEKGSRWPCGTPLRAYELRDGDYLMPYIDGGTQSVTEPDCDGLMHIDSDGDISASQTDGTAEIGGRCTCEDCGARMHEDNAHSVGYDSDRTVCDTCIDDYTHVTGRRGNDYYVPNCEAVEVGGNYYDSEYLSDNDIVQLHDGDYVRNDDAVYIESEGEYYPSESEDVCYDEYNGQYELYDNCVQLHDGDFCRKDDAWKCAATGNMYDDSTAHVTIDGEMYHPDDAPEQDDEDDADDEAAPAAEATPAPAPAITN